MTDLQFRKSTKLINTLTLDWPTDKFEAIQYQKLASGRIRTSANTADPTIVAAVDTAYGLDGNILYASAVTMSWPNLELIEQVSHYGLIQFPHLPGMIFFREGPLIAETFSQLNSDPDLIIVNGHGQSHPDGCGMAGHIGLLFDRPTIGCARRLLVGKHFPLNDAKGANQVIRYHGQNVGVAFRSKEAVKPIFISAGHLCDTKYAKRLVVSMLRGFRQPEPLRLAHLQANKHKRKMEKALNRSKKILPTN